MQVGGFDGGCDFTIRAIFAAGLRSRVAPISSAKVISAASTASAARSATVFTARGSRSSARGGAARLSLLLITPTPPRQDAAQIWEGDVQPCAPAIVTVTVATFVWNAVTPLPICPIGRANGSGANRVHSRHAPARRAAPCQARSRLAWAREGPPAPLPPKLGRRQPRRSTRASLSPLESLNGP